MTNITRMHSGTRMSQIVIHGDTVYLAGQVPDDFNADIQEQTRQTLAKVEKLLAEAGSSKENILSATVYIRDMKDFAAMNEVWDAWVPEGHAPGRACIQAPMAAPTILFEVQVIAAKA